MSVLWLMIGFALVCGCRLFGVSVGEIPVLSR